MNTAVAIRPNLIDEIHAAHADAEEALRGAVDYCIKAGNLLIEAKRLHGKHGQWSKWLTDNITFSDRTARAYMQLARLPEEKRQRVADLPLRDALSAIRSREQRIADAEEREARVLPAARVIEGPAVDRPPVPPRPPPTLEEVADDLIHQLADVTHEARNNGQKIEVEHLRAAFGRRFDDVEPADTGCDGPEDFWRRLIMNAAGEAIAAADPVSWEHRPDLYADWREHAVTSEMVTLAKQAAEAWTKLAELLEGRRS
jgi:hypothetical protein